MAGWHHWLDGRESEWTPGVGDGQGGLVCCNSWGRKELDTTERLIWSDLIMKSSNSSHPQIQNLKFKGTDISCVCVCVCVCVCAQLGPTLCNPMDFSPPGSSVHGIFQAGILEQVAISSSRGSSRPRDGICISCIGSQILYHWATREALDLTNMQCIFNYFVVGRLVFGTL